MRKIAAPGRGTWYFSFPGVVLALGMFVVPATAQGPDITQVKEAIAKNKAQLSHYTWNEQDIISLKGEEKKEELYQVQLGPNGKPQKTNLDPNSVSDSDRHSRGLRGRIKEKKIDEYKEYIDSIKTLIQQYLPPQQDLIEQAKQQGNISIGGVGSPNELRLIIANYVKPNDSMTLSFDKQLKAITSIQINTYLSDPSDAVTVSVQFAQLPDGTNHVTMETINGVSKQLTIAVQNSNYQHM